MKNDKAVLSFFDYPGEFLDKIVEQLAKVGVDVGPLGSQLVLLLLAAATLFAFRRQFWPLRSARPWGLISGVAVIVLAAGVIYSWIYQLIKPLPDHVYGKVHAAELSNIRVSVIDLQGELIPAGTGAVDTVTGEFALRYRVSFGDRPRALRVSKPGCEERRYPISRARLRAQEEFILDFTCAAKR
jgi:amino acid transporter